MLLAEMGKSRKALPTPGLQLFHHQSVELQGLKITIARHLPVAAYIQRGFGTAFIEDVRTRSQASAQFRSTRGFVGYAFYERLIQLLRLYIACVGNYFCAQSP